MDEGDAETTPRGTWPLRFALTGAGLLVLGVGLAFLELVPPLVGLAAFSLGAMLGLFAVSGGVFAVRRGGEGNRGGRAILAGLAVMGPLVVGFVSGIGYPSINDVTTDTASPPQFEAALSLDANSGRDMGYRRAFVAAVEEYYGDLETLRVAASPAEVVAKAESLAKERGWEITQVDPERGHLEAVARTALFRFADDVVIRAVRDGDDVRVDMRSKSRVGKGDMGTNYERIKAFMRDLEQALAR